MTDIERDVAGQKYIIPHIVRAANRKTVRELHDEIRAARRADVNNVLRRFRLLFLLPVLYRPLYKLAFMLFSQDALSLDFNSGCRPVSPRLLMVSSSSRRRRG